MTARANAQSFPLKPYLKPWYRLARDGDRSIFQYGDTLVVFEGKAVQLFLPVLLPLLDGTRTLGEIEAYLGEAVTPATRKALSLLHEYGLLMDGPPPAADTPLIMQQTLYFLAAQGRSTSIVERSDALQRASAAVLGSSAVTDEVARLLSRCGMNGVELLSWETQKQALLEFDLVLAIPSGKELSYLSSWNRLALDAGTPWLHLLPFDGKFAAVGPLYVPKETCCYECFQMRRAANVGYAQEFRALQNTPAPYPSMPPLDAMLAGLAAIVAIRWLVDRDPFLPGRFYALELGLEIRFSLHTVHRVPRCTACSDQHRLGSPLPWHERAIG